MFMYVHMYTHARGRDLLAILEDFQEVRKVDPPLLRRCVRLFRISGLSLPKSETQNLGGPSPGRLGSPIALTFGFEKLCPPVAVAGVGVCCRANWSRTSLDPVVGA